MCTLSILILITSGVEAFDSAYVGHKIGGQSQSRGWTMARRDPCPSSDRHKSLEVGTESNRHKCR